MTSTSRSARLAKWLSVPLGLVLSALLIWQASYAAFSDKATSDNNTWTAGHVTIDRVDAGDGTPLFTVPAMAPGQTGSEEVTVTYTGNLDAQLSFYGEVPQNSGDVSMDSTLTDHIHLVVEGAVGDTFAAPSGKIFEGSLTKFLGENPDFDGGLQYDTAGTSVRTGTFKFTYTFAEDPPESLQGMTAVVNFVVEAKHIPQQG